VSAFTVYQVAVTRAGSAVTGSPFWAKLYRTASKRSTGQTIPAQLMSQSHKVCSFVDPLTPVKVADIITLPTQQATDWGSAYAKIIDPRRYERSLQCDLQIVPFTPLDWFDAKTLSASIQSGSFNVSSEGYAPASSATTLGFLEPATGQERMMIAGDLDTRAAWLYTLSDSLAQNDVIKDTQGLYWIAKTATEFYPFTNDFKTGMTLLEKAPPGVS
jgi:hypothetical protein